MLVTDGIVESVIVHHGHAHILRNLLQRVLGAGVGIGRCYGQH